MSLSATVSAWELPYEGDAHQVLRGAIKKIENERSIKDAYANMISIIQSSGTGKSRMVDQLATVEFVFPFNLRLQEEVDCEYLPTRWCALPNLALSAFAYPYPNNEVRDFLMECKGTDKRLVGMEYCAFLIALFEKARAALVNAPLNPGHRLASWWRDFLKTTRSSFFTEVIKEAHTIHSKLRNQAVCIHLDHDVHCLLTTLHTIGNGY